MILLDSDIVIYSTKPNFDSVLGLFSSNEIAVSIITYIEVLGYHKITHDDRNTLAEFFEVAKVIPLSEEIARMAIELRQTRPIKLGDSLISATAIVNDLPLVTNNIKDFNWIESLTLIDPFRDQ